LVESFVSSSSPFSLSFVQFLGCNSKRICICRSFFLVYFYILCYFNYYIELQLRSVFMPFINVKISENLSDTQVDNIKSRLGEAISLIPGKSEAWLMVNIQDNCKLYFKGRNDKPTAFTDVSIFGSAAKSDCENLTAAVCDILSEDAGVPSDRSYVKFEFSDKWGYDGYMF
jgi:hypothetical protein